MTGIPQETIETVLALAAEGLPIAQVAFMSRVSQAAVCAILEASEPENKPAAPEGG